MANTKAKCIVCGKEYNVCLSCKEVKTLSPWKEICDTSECYKVFMIASEFNNKLITKDDAKRKLSKVDYNKDELLGNIRNVVDEIISVPKKMSEPLQKKNIEKSTTK